MHLHGLMVQQCVHEALLAVCSSH